MTPKQQERIKNLNDIEYLSEIFIKNYFRYPINTNTLPSKRKKMLNKQIRIIKSFYYRLVVCFRMKKEYGLKVFGILFLKYEYNYWYKNGN